MLNPDTAVEMAKKQGWRLRDHQPSICLLILERGKEQMNVYYSKMTIGTIVPHPKGKKQLYRKNVTLAEFVALLRKPPEHTGKGYSRVPHSSNTALIGKSEQNFEDTDQHEMFNLAHFMSQEEELVHAIWKLKPKVWTGLVERAAMKEVAVKRVQEFKIHLHSLTIPEEQL